MKPLVKRVRAERAPAERARAEQVRDERGFSLIEIIIGMVILTTALLGLSSAAGLALQTTMRGRQEIQMWAAVQWKADSLISLGWGNVATGADTVNGYPMSWTVSGTDLEQIDLSLDHPSVATGAMIRNTLTLYLTN